VSSTTSASRSSRWRRRVGAERSAVPATRARSHRAWTPVTRPSTSTRSRFTAASPRGARPARASRARRQEARVRADPPKKKKQRYADPRPTLMRSRALAGTPSRSRSPRSREHARQRVTPAQARRGLVYIRSASRASSRTSCTRRRTLCRNGPKVGRTALRSCSRVAIYRARTTADVDRKRRPLPLADAARERTATTAHRRRAPRRGKIAASSRRSSSGRSAPLAFELRERASALWRHGRIASRRYCADRSGSI